MQQSQCWHTRAVTAQAPAGGRDVHLRRTAGSSSWGLLVAPMMTILLSGSVSMPSHSDMNSVFMLSDTSCSCCMRLPNSASASSAAGDTKSSCNVCALVSDPGTRRCMLAPGLQACDCQQALWLCSQQRIGACVAARRFIGEVRSYDLTNKNHTSRLLRQLACQLEDASHMLVRLTIPFALQVTGLDCNKEGLTLLCNGLQTQKACVWILNL